MGRLSSSVMANVEGAFGAGYEPQESSYTNMFGTASGAGEGFEKGSTARRALIIWGASAAWLVLVWRAVRGF